MTVEAQAVYTVIVRGHIDGAFKEWEGKIFERVAREMQLQFGGSAQVLRSHQVTTTFTHRGNSMIETLTDANGYPIKRGADVQDVAWFTDGEARA